MVQKKYVKYFLLIFAVLCWLICFGSFSYRQETGSDPELMTWTLKLGLPLSPWFYWQENVDGREWYFNPFFSISGLINILGLISFLLFLKVKSMKCKI